MILQKVKKVLAAVLMGSMISTLTVSASDIQDGNDRQVTARDGQAENRREESNGSNGELPDEKDQMSVQDQPADAGWADAETAGEAAADGGLQNAADKKEAAGDGEDQTDGEMPGDSGAPAKEETAEDASASNEEKPDERTQSILEEYSVWLRQMRAQTVGSYSSELAKFPASYQTYLKQLHAKHPNWIFVAVEQNLNWNDIVTAESVSGSSTGTNRSLLPKTADGLLLSKAKTDYNASKGSYIPKDGSTWVSASKPAVAYYADPRNFLTDDYIYMFEALNYDSGYHTAEGVRNVLSGTELYGDKKITYTKTDGKKTTLDLTYEQAIFAAGAKNKVSPLFLAAKIRQETGAKLSNGSISGNYSYGGKSYRGYYNYYNIGAYSTTGSAIANGLVFAKGGTNKSKTYKRPWTSPVLAIDGGAEYIAKSYISRGQNTVYFQRFNTISSPYYQHQYMQNLTAAASEAKSTCNSYSKMGILNDAFVFYIPVYQNMPSQSAKVTISKSVKTGKTTSSAVMRSAPSTGSSSVMTVPEGKKVTVSGAEYTDMSVSVAKQEKYPYWFKVSYGGKTGYIPSRFIKMNTDGTVKAGDTKQLSVTGAGSREKVYYETSNPAVATVSSTGKITGVKAGTCDIYAFSSSGKRMDAVGISVSGSASEVSKPKLVSAANSKSGITIKWKKVSGADGYYVYRKTSGAGYKKIKKITSGATVKYTDKAASPGQTCTYTVKAYKDGKTSGCDKTGLTVRRLKNPVMVSAAGTKTGIKVKWKKVKGAASYDVLRKVKGGKYKKIASVKSSGSTYTDKTAEKGKTYYYTARAIYGATKGAYTESGVCGKRK